MMRCEICGSTSIRKIAEMAEGPQIWHCRGCRTDAAALSPRTAPAVAQEDHFKDLDLKKYLKSVGATRHASYPRLLERVTRFVRSGRWLDVGCSYGWLLAEVRRRGFTGFGVEPSLSAARAAAASGAKVAVGSFPSLIASRAVFAVVSLMDVLEHLESPGRVLQAVGRLLQADGLVAVQIPDRDCLLYRVALMLNAVSAGRLSFALRRLWLVGFDFPHRWYFSGAGLVQLLRSSGYAVLDLYRSPIGTTTSAVSRVSYEGRMGGVWSGLVGAAVAAIGILDRLLRHGGLITVLARPTGSSLQAAP